MFLTISEDRGEKIRDLKLKIMTEVNLSPSSPSLLTAIKEDMFLSIDYGFRIHWIVGTDLDNEMLEDLPERGLDHTLQKPTFWSLVNRRKRDSLSVPCSADCNLDEK